MLAPFVTSQGAASWDAINACWSAQVFIPDLGHRFWKLTLQVCFLFLTFVTLIAYLTVVQILSRYRSWIEGSLPAIDASFRSAGTGTGIERRGQVRVPPILAYKYSLIDISRHPRD